MSFSTAHVGSEPGDFAGFHERGIRRRYFRRDDDAALWRHLELLVLRFRKAPNNARSDIANILHTRRYIRVVQLSKAADDTGDFKVSILTLIQRGFLFHNLALLSLRKWIFSRNFQEGEVARIPSWAIQ